MGTGLASFVARLSERKEPPARIPAAQVPTKVLLRMSFSQDVDKREMVINRI
jgi:hypothetical protein